MAEMKRNNVKDFGALGDGDLTKDDSVAIQKAIDDLYKSPIDGVSGLFEEGGIVYFPPGSYVVKKPIYIKRAGVTLEGLTPMSTQIVPISEELVGKKSFDDQTDGNAVFEFVYYNGAELPGNRTFIRNIGIRNLGFNLRGINTTTTIRILRPYDLCLFENLIFFNIRGTAIKAVGEYGEIPDTKAKGLGQGLILRDIHIDNSATVSDSMTNGIYTTTTKLLDSGRIDLAEKPAIHLENINESSLTNVKFIACMSQVDENGNIIRKQVGDEMVRTPAQAPRQGVLLEGCAGISIKESSFTNISKPAIHIRRGTYGRQMQALYHFIQSNTFEEITGSGVTIDGGAPQTDDKGRKGVSQITISENRFLGNSINQYAYILDNCDLVTIRDRATIYIGEKASNTTVYAVDTNSGITPKIVDKGLRSIIMGRKYNTLDQENTYTFNTRIEPRRITIPTISKNNLYNSSVKDVEGDIVLVASDDSSEHKLAILRKWIDGSLRWTYMQSELVLAGQLEAINPFLVEDTYIRGVYSGDVWSLIVTATLMDGSVIVKKGGTLKDDGTFEFYYKGVVKEFRRCKGIQVETLDRAGNKLSEHNVEIIRPTLLISPNYQVGGSFITGNYTMVKTLGLYVADEDVEYPGGDLNSDGSLNIMHCLE
ncbi:Phage upper baseplate protein [Listeria weihenstephanensis FSL R9-0317]|uniref:Uncharacterized protein n=1 Tax=Listeria weihenstephanensis TaxID=1006155 RepID=A0A1S7FV76_9LIST|nr:glycosyl hydrolase family 28-related protein [Listeria weihenstephanensis]AQY51338.1 hypothetical protein UE46_09905 [Listeria weihenstephanensis]EUJ37137.1 Phage upper baseplate protein [Listeria weihenstephanensis FSL R9-0317]